MITGMVNMSKRQQPHLDENVSPRSSTGLNERGNPHTTGQTAAAQKDHYTQVQQKSCPYILK